MIAVKIEYGLSVLDFLFRNSGMISIGSAIKANPSIKCAYKNKSRIFYIPVLAEKVN